jgi:hypothetical protein
LENNKSDKKDKKISVAYFVVNEDLYSPLLRRQVVELLEDINLLSDSLKITIFLFQSLTSLVSKKNSIKLLRIDLKEAGINLVVLPNICPWPFPNFSIRKTDVGWRPNGIWNRWAARFFSVYAQFFMVPIFLLGKFRIYHCRSYPASYAAMITKKLFPKLRLLFDPRSDFPEEHVVAGSWGQDSKDFKFWKQAERDLLLYADTTACISESYAAHFSENASSFSYFIAPNNVRTSNFARNEKARKKLRQQWGVKDSESVFVYLGGMSSKGWHRPGFYIKFYDALKALGMNPVFLFLVPSHANSIIFEKRGTRDKIFVVNPIFGEVRNYLSAADYGMMFMHKRRLAVGTKIGEYLAASLPIIANKNCLGTVEFIKDNKKAGNIIRLGLGDLDIINKISMQDIDILSSLHYQSDFLIDIANKIFDNSNIAKTYLQNYKNNILL